MTQFKLDECLTQSRRHPASVRECNEKIEEYARQARRLIETAKTIGIFTPSEDEHFKFLTQIAIPAWKQELAHAQEFTKQVLSQSQYAGGPIHSHSPLKERTK